MLVEEIVQHFSASNSALDSPTIITYLQGPSGPAYRKASTEPDPHWYLYDGLGSVVGEVDPLGNVTASKLFDVYGATRGGSGTPTTRQGFVGGLGHETDDETGLVYMRARYYDPGVGRFTSEDPSQAGMNWFAYCIDNPVNYVDESGKDILDDVEKFFMYQLKWATGDIADALIHLGWGLIGGGITQMVTGRRLKAEGEAEEEDGEAKSGPNFVAMLIGLPETIDGRLKEIKGGALLTGGVRKFVAGLICWESGHLLKELSDDL